MSLRWRLNLLVALLNLGFLLVLTWLLVNNHRESIREEIEAAHRVAVQMLGTAAQTSSVFGPPDIVMAAFLQGVGRVRANDIRLVGTDGRLLFTSPPSQYKEGRSAPAWFAELMWPNVDATVIALPGARVEVVPDPSRAILDAWDRIILIVLVGTGFVALLHTALLFALRHLLEPTEADARRLVATTRELAQNREVTRLIHAGVEDERKRLARELHDELGQSVTAIRLVAATIERGGGLPVPQGAARIDAIAASIYDSVHRIVRELRPAALEQQDLRAALQDVARDWRMHHPSIALDMHLEGDLSDLGEEPTLAVFRSIQEALTNVAKHAAAQNVTLEVVRSDAGLDVAISDDGQAGAFSLGGSGRGLGGMRERIMALGGSLEAGEQPAGGFRVALHVPLPESAL
jgi:two-component system, NarL family, sensor histidine kinase UhpB